MEPTISRYYHLDVEVGPERIGQVERILAAHLRHWGLRTLVDPVCHCTRLLLRAIDEHGPDRTAVVEMWWAGQHLVTAVSDRNRQAPAERVPPEGLSRVAEWSDGWGRYPGPGGTTVWFSCRVRTADPVPTAIAAVPVAG
ncbi:pep a2 [Streptomyces sp. SID5785]|uniref:pep a2 n=1 Tax=Streptomyces sp. SID5785 TaxID=2690309 RepID=UPI0013617834|nr:pep a2 [Streptomyces sp. SID5785]MZD04592.1 pep a2 [Streptomyces sp. SID5785]